MKPNAPNNAPGGTGSEPVSRMLALEPRVLLDAALITTLDQLAGETSGASDDSSAQDTSQDHTGELELLASLEGYQPPASERLELVFIDARVADADRLIAQFERVAEVHLLSADRDGLEQISEVLAERQQVDAIHLISHATEGQLILGSQTIDTTSLSQRSEALEGWREALASDADLLLYGCDLAADQSGRDFVDQLADLTGADVAASTDTTGADGDWTLEFESGRIETDSLLDDSADYSHRLANDPPTLTATPLNPTLVENGAGVTVFSGASLTPDSINPSEGYSALQLAVTNPLNPGFESLNVLGTTISLGNNHSGAASSFNYTVTLDGGNNRVLVDLTMLATDQATILSLVNGITYLNTSDAPSGNRTVQILRITDQDSPVVTSNPSLTSTVTITPVNDPPGGSLSIDNTSPTTGDTLSAINSLTDADGMGIISYSWQASADSGVTWNQVGLGPSLFLTAAQAGNQIRVVGSYTDGGGTNESVPSLATAAVIDGNSPPSGSVDINNLIPTEGDTLFATSTLTDPDGLGPLVYTWQYSADGGATWNSYTASGPSLTMTQTEVGRQIRVLVSYIDGKGNPESVVSAATAAVANLNSPPSGSVSFSGLLVEGETLFASNTIIDGDGLGPITYTWESSADGGSTWTNLGTGTAFLLDQPQVGTQMRVVASYTDGGGTAEQLASLASVGTVANVNDPPIGGPVINGVLLVGQTLSASDNLSDPDGLGAITYSWFSVDPVNGSLISLGSGPTVVLTSAELGLKIKLEASYTDAYGTFESVSTITSVPVADINDPPVAVDDLVSITPSVAATVSGNLLSNDFDINGDAITLVSVAGSGASPVAGTYGTLTWTSSGGFSYAANAKDPALLPLGPTQSITDSFGYSITDAFGNVASAVLKIDLFGANDPPVVLSSPGSLTNSDGETIVMNLATHFADPDLGDTLTYGASGLPLGLSMSSTGVITGQISSLASGLSPLPVTLYATDSGGASVSTSFSWVINNPAPMALADGGLISTSRDTPLVLNPLANDSDPDGDALSLLAINGLTGGLIQGEFGTLTVNPDATVSYRLNLDNPLLAQLPDGHEYQDQFSYTIADAQGATATNTITIRITGENHLPELGDQSLVLIEDEITSITGNLFAEAFDADGQPLQVYDLRGEASYGTFTWQQDGAFLYELNNELDEVQALNEGKQLVERFEIVIIDPRGAIAIGQLELAIQGRNDAPELLPDFAFPQSSSGETIEPIDLTQWIRDKDADDLVLVQIDNLPSGISLDEAGFLVGTLSDGAGAFSPYEVRFTLTDLSGAETIETRAWVIDGAGAPHNPNIEPPEGPGPGENTHYAPPPPRSTVEFILQTLRGEGRSELYVSDLVNENQAQTSLFQRLSLLERGPGDGPPVPPGSNPPGQDPLSDAQSREADGAPTGDTAPPLSDQLDSAGQRFERDVDEIIKLLQEAARQTRCAS